MLLVSLPGLFEFKDLGGGLRRALSYSTRIEDVRLNTFVMLSGKFGSDSGAKPVGGCAGDGAVRVSVYRCNWMIRWKSLEIRIICMM